VRSQDFTPPILNFAVPDPSIAEGLGPDAWLAYAGHVNTRADRRLYCLANRFVQSPPTMEEAFPLAELFDHLGQPFAASAIRDRFQDEDAS